MYVITFLLNLFLVSLEIILLIKFSKWVFVNYHYYSYPLALNDTYSWRFLFLWFVVIGSWVGIVLATITPLITIHKLIEEGKYDAFRSLVSSFKYNSIKENEYPILSLLVESMILFIINCNIFLPVIVVCILLFILLVGFGLLVGIFTIGNSVVFSGTLIFGGQVILTLFTSVGLLSGFVVAMPTSILISLRNSIMLMQFKMKVKAMREVVVELNEIVTEKKMTI